MGSQFVADEQNGFRNALMMMIIIKTEKKKEKKKKGGKKQRRKKELRVSEQGKAMMSRANLEAFWRSQPKCDGMDRRSKGAFTQTPFSIWILPVTV